MTDEADFKLRHRLDALVRERKDALITRWLVATITISVYSTVLGFRSSPLPDDIPAVVSSVFWLVALAFAALAVVLPRRFLGEAELRTQLREEVDLEAWSSTMRLKPEQTRELAQFPLREQRLFGLTQVFVRPYTLGLALSGAVAITGFFYGLVSDSLIAAAPLLLGALVLNCWHYPRLAEIVDRGRRILDREEEEEALNEIQGMRTAPRKPRPRQASGPVHPPAADGASSSDAKHRLYEMLREREAKQRARRSTSGES